MVYRIRYFQRDVKMGDIASDKSLAETREDAVDQMDLFAADYALIVDHAGQVIERVLRSA